MRDAPRRGRRHSLVAGTAGPRSRLGEAAGPTPSAVPLVRPRGAAGGTAIVTECAYTWRADWVGDGSSANMATAVAAQGRYVVSVEATDYRRPYATSERMRAQAIAALKASLDRL